MGRLGETSMNDPETEEVMEPERIRKGSPFARRFFKMLGMQSARDERLSREE